MRQAGLLSSQQDANRLADYLLTLGVSTRVLEESDGWAVWVRDDDRLEQARSELQRYKDDPADPRFNAADDARRIRNEQAQTDRAARRNFVEVRSRWELPLHRRMPMTAGLMLICMAVAVITSLGQTPASNWLIFGTLEAVAAQPWRAITPIFLHYGIAHLLFNMLMFYRFSGTIELVQGTGKLAGLILLIALTSNFGQFAAGQPPLTQTPHIAAFGGMSGVVYGLFGFIWSKSRFDPWSGYTMDPQTIVIMVLWFVLCLTGLVGNIANTAHGVGLAVGVAAGYGSAMWNRRNRA